ncbi:hypothetical protein Pfo_023100 [Paulownia fortunei]|nr:hypothetical protein Pfo_023100 [Paulownia fortunei]
MDSFEAAKVVHNRIEQLEPHVARKIIGYMYLQEIPEQEMIRLALGPDSLILNLIQKAKTALLLPSAPIISNSISPTMNPNPLSLSDPPMHFTPFSLASPGHFSAPASFRRVATYWDPQLATEQQPIHNTGLKLIPYSDSEYGLQNQFRGLEDPLDAELGSSGFPNDYYGPETVLNNLSIRGSRNSPNIIDYPVKSCHYFNKGFCKHGSNCRYFHGESFPESYPHMFGPNSYEPTSEDQVFYPGSLEKLELEVVELLKSRRGNPISIASLPMMYYEKYGRTLQAEGYLTESQRHGKAGYSLTKLIARLKNSIRLIDRPHGQHAVILAKDAPKYMDIWGERNDPGPIVSGSRQIYLTFPAESTFTEEDVSNYFSTFGPVQDVRIPCQQRRMFGFVTFVSADTVKLILSKGNPHYVCGARVLVKPYREKSKLVERKYLEKFDPHMYYHSHPTDIDLELQAMINDEFIISNCKSFFILGSMLTEFSSVIHDLLSSSLHACLSFPFFLFLHQLSIISFSIGFILLMSGLESYRLFRRQLRADHDKALELETRHLSQLQLAPKPLAGQSCLGYSMDELKVPEDHPKFPSGEHYNYLLDVLNSGSTSDDNPKYPVNTCSDQESVQGVNLPDSPFASAVASSISAVM